VVGLSILSGAHMTLFPARCSSSSGRKGREGHPHHGRRHHPERGHGLPSTRMGTGRLFGPGTPTSELIDYIRAWFRRAVASGSLTRP